MQLMPNVKLSPKEIGLLRRTAKFDAGSEAIICYTNNPHTLYKIFLEDSFVKDSPVRDMGENKERKIIELYQRQVDYMVKPVSTISMNGRLVGYEMTYDCDNKRIVPFQLSREALIHFLNQSKDVLNYFSTQEIVYGDVYYNNILLNQRTSQIEFCDIDNIQLGDYEIDLYESNLESFVIEYGRVDSNADIFMHNIMTLDGFYIEFCNCCYEEVEYQFGTAGAKIFDTMKRPKQFNGEYIVQYVKKK